MHRWVLSGGIGSGKSEVRRLLVDAGVATIDADSIGHEVIEPDGAAFQVVGEHWPEVVVAGRIDRKSLAAIVFADADQLRQLEALTHPHIIGTIITRVEEFDAPIVVEMPKLHHGLGEEWSRIVVDCEDETRLARAAERGMSRADALARMGAQPSRAQWLAAADLVVPNQGSRDELAETVAPLLKLL